jgi:hypothetical protein
MVKKFFEGLIVDLAENAANFGGEDEDDWTELIINWLKIYFLIS